MFLDACKKMRKILQEPLLYTEIIFNEPCEIIHIESCHWHFVSRKSADFWLR